MKKTIATAVLLSLALFAGEKESVAVKNIAVRGCESVLSGKTDSYAVALKLLFDGIDSAISAELGKPAVKNPPESSIVEECKVWRNTGLSPLLVHQYAYLLRFYGKERADGFLRKYMERKVENERIEDEDSQFCEKGGSGLPEKESDADKNASRK